MKTKSNTPNKRNNVIETILVVIAILVIPLLFAINTEADKSTTTPSQPITVPDIVEDTSDVVKPKQPPACTFPLAQTTTEESVPEEYVFSEPEVVMTSKYQTNIIEWLPDNQNALIMLTDDQLFNGVAGYLQTIELFNPEIQEARIFATRRDFGENALPAWNPALNAVVYPATNVLGKDASNNLKTSREIRISYGNSDNTQVLADNLSQYYISVKPDGSQVAYFTDKQLIRLDDSLNPLSSVPFDRKLLDFKHENSNKETVDYKLVWRPNSSQIFVYNWAYDNLEYTYILDANTGELCNLNFDGWAFVAQWSPNGRYLGIIRAQGIVPVQKTDLSILDTVTGNLYTIDLPQQYQEGKYYINDFTWAPDNRHIFLMGGNYKFNKYNGMVFLSDFATGEMNHITPSHTFTDIWAVSNLAWSPDGSKILINCPISNKDSQVCLISVQTISQ